MKQKNYPNYIETYELNGNSIKVKRIVNGNIVYINAIRFDTRAEAVLYYSEK